MLATARQQAWKNEVKNKKAAARTKNAGGLPPAGQSLPAFGYQGIFGQSSGNSG